MAILMTLIIIIYSMTSILHAQEMGNLLQNPGFEEGTSSWQSYEVDFSSFVSPAHDGNHAASIAASSGKAGWIYQITPVYPGSAYTLSGWALKNPDDTYATVCLGVSWYETEDGFGIEIGYNVSPCLGNEPGYCFLTTGEITAPLNAHSVRIKAMLDPFSQNNVTAYFDDLTFVGPTPITSPSSTTAPEPTPTPTSTPTPTPSPTLTSSPIFTPTPAPTRTSTPTFTPTTTPTPMYASTSPLTPTKEGDLVINEIQYNPPQIGADHAFEWIELLNRTNQTADLTGWKIADNNESDPFPSLILPSGGFAIVAAGSDFYVNFPSFEGNIVFIADGSIGNGLSNTSDRLTLIDPTGKIVDALSYGDDSTIMSPPCQNVAEGHSLERQPPGFDTNRASDFVDNAAPSPGYGLASPTPTPTITSTPTISPTPPPTPAPSLPRELNHGPIETDTSTPTATVNPTYTSTPIPSLTPMPSLIPPPSVSQTSPWAYIRTSLFLFITALTLLSAVLWLKKRD
jgi:Lamin Tail Domain/Carbohydrate binding domain